MSVTAAPGPAPRHPWVATFERAPEQALGELLAGYARVPPYERADAPDAARMLFAPLPPDDPARVALGPAILGWLRQRRREKPPAAPARLQRWVREICEAFEIVSLLDVTDAAAELRWQYAAWNEWSARFVLSPARDAHAEYWRMLALTQPLLVRAGAVNQADALLPLWLDICRQAGDPLPRHYLEIGLLGLRRLSQPPAGSEAPFVAGLARWAAEQKPSEREFLSEWRALKPLYPRSAARWRVLVRGVLGAPSFRLAGIEAPAWWGGDPDLASIARNSAAHQPASGLLDAPHQRDAEAVIDHLDEPWRRIEPALDRLMRGHKRYLAATGDTYYYVRAIHMLGRALIRSKGDDTESRARKAQSLAIEGIQWQPYDRFLWSLWRDALEAEGAIEAAELIGWETIRRDPDDVDKRNQLAILLVQRCGRPDDAEALLVETIAMFPNDAVARTELAELMIATDRIKDAQAVLDAAFAAQAADEATYGIQARLHSHDNRPADAIMVVRLGLDKFPSATTLQAYQRQLLTGGKLNLLSAAMRMRGLATKAVASAGPTPDKQLEDVFRFARLRRLRFVVEEAAPARREAALQEVRAILRDDPAFAYAGLLAARLGALDAPETLPSFAVAFEQALAQGDRARLEALAKQQPRLQALTLVARAVLGDEAAASLVEALLKSPPERHEARPVTLLRAGLQPILAAANDVPVPQAMLRHRDAILRRLYDANEAALGDRIAA